MRPTLEFDVPWLTRKFEAKVDPPSFESAGDHFNPTKAEHGSKNPRGPHAGDLPDIVVDATGRGHLELTTKRAAGRLRRQTRDRAPATPEAPPSARPSRTFERRPRCAHERPLSEPDSLRMMTPTPPPVARSGHSLS